MPIKPGAITIEIIHQIATTITMIILFTIMGMIMVNGIMKEGKAAMEVNMEAAAMEVGMGVEVMAGAAINRFVVRMS
jgi:hypothetical protein